MSDTAKLIAQARALRDDPGTPSLSRMFFVMGDLVFALEAAVEQTLRWQNAYDRERAKNEAAEAENRRLREALAQVQAIQPRTLEMLRQKSIVFKHAPMPNPDDSFELVAFWIYNDLCEADLIARSALSEGET